MSDDDEPSWIDEFETFMNSRSTVELHSTCNLHVRSSVCCDPNQQPRKTIRMTTHSQHLSVNHKMMPDDQQAAEYAAYVSAALAYCECRDEAIEDDPGDAAE